MVFFVPDCEIIGMIILYGSGVVMIKNLEMLMGKDKQKTYLKVDLSITSH